MCKTIQFIGNIMLSIIRTHLMRVDEERIEDILDNATQKQLKIILENKNNEISDNLLTLFILPIIRFISTCFVFGCVSLLFILIFKLIASLPVNVAIILAALIVSMAIIFVA